MLQRSSLVVVSLGLFAACTLKVGDLGELTEDSSYADPSAADSSGADSSGEPATTGGPGQTSGEPATTGDTEDASTGDPTAGTTGELAPATGVDILFVIDNSGSMAEEQQRLAAAISELVTPLTTAGLDLRIAVTTTDSGNPRCPAATYKPENGAFQAVSCRAKVAANEWEFNGEDFSASCLDACVHEHLSFNPTTTANDPSPKERPWIEWNDGVSNVDQPLTEALGCMLPQGITGCGFESPLESMYLALAGTQSEGNANFDFLRTEADLLVVIVTDETDCSWVPEFKDIFTTNTVFWNDPADPAPTSGLCWRAGIECSGGPGTYDDCVATDRDNTGAVTADPSEAVLHPVSRYQGVLSTIVAGKQAAGSAGQVHVAAIAGVPVGYPTNPLVFADSLDPAVQASFGVAPGCQDGDVMAAPPGRIRELVEQTAPLGPGLFSICEPSFAASLGTIAAGLTAD